MSHTHQWYAQRMSPSGWRPACEIIGCPTVGGPPYPDKDEAYRWNERDADIRARRARLMAPAYSAAGIA